MKRVLLTVALVGLLLVPVIALAAPDRTLTLSASKASATWDGPSANGVTDPAGVTAQDPAACTKDAPSYCDQTLVKIESGGSVKLEASIGGYSNAMRRVGTATGIDGSS